MKKYYLLLTLISFLVSNAQNVGINTNNPSAQLDINGNTIIRTVPVAPAPLTNTYDFLVLNPATKEVQKVNGNFNRNTTIAKVSQKEAVTLLDVGVTGRRKINFATPVIDLGSNFSATTDLYTIPSTGVYEIYYYFRYGTGLQISLLGSTEIAIYKQVASNTPVLVDSKAFSGVNLEIPSILITPAIPVAYVTISSTEINSAYQFTAGDKLSFEVVGGNGLLVGVLGSSRAEFVIKKISN